ncbi:MAG: hypothetical protein J6S05_03540 [Bacteroidaceae bacterium]|nr:hypothetical protein [Bacteroidaceae bacterium]
MSAQLANNKRIAKNTIALYFRTFITMIVSLYTSRVMLQALGVDNYGINNVIGGIVAMSSLITGAVTQSITRFITYALGEGDKQRMKVVFSTSVNVMIALSIIAVLALEIAGVWFLTYKADIPDGRMIAAHWVLQCSIVTLVLNLISQPYNATIIAHEHMSIYAYMSIVDVTLKLAVCFVIKAFDGDRLILFAILNTAIALCMRLFYSWYCAKHFDESRYNYRLFDKSFFNEMSQFTGWYLVGNGVWVFNTQGLNMLINVFFGVALNAARGVAISVTNSITSFVSNFTVAFIPQITKSYASKDMDRVLFLVFQGTKFTWFLIFLFIVPVFWEADTLLKLWLEEPPAFASLFLRFALFESWSIIISFALHNVILASGQLKRVQLRIALYTAFIFPLTWLCYSLGAPVWISYVIFILLNTTAKGFTLVELKRIIDFPVLRFMKECVLRCTIITIIAFVVPGIFVYIMPQSTLRFFIVVPIAIIWTLLCEFTLGLSKSERALVLSTGKKMVNKFFSKN